MLSPVPENFQKVKVVVKCESTCVIITFPWPSRIINPSWSLMTFETQHLIAMIPCVWSTVKTFIIFTIAGSHPSHHHLVFKEMWQRIDGAWHENAEKIDHYWFSLWPSDKGSKASLDKRYVSCFCRIWSHAQLSLNIKSWLLKTKKQVVLVFLSFCLFISLFFCFFCLSRCNLACVDQVRVENCNVPVQAAISYES